MLDSNQRPFRCQRKALPTELTTPFKKVIFFFLQTYVIILLLNLLIIKVVQLKKTILK